MTWVKKVPPPHKCKLPVQGFTKEIGPGSLWRCDNCQKEWILVRVDSSPTWAKRAIPSTGPVVPSGPASGVKSA